MEESVTAADWKTTLVEVGLGLLFVIKFGKFLVLEIWDVIRPLLRKLRSKR